MAYLTLAQFTDLSVMPRERIREIEADNPGWLDRQLDFWSRYIDGRLRKRYAAPFSETDIPQAVKLWLSLIVTQKCYIKQGVDATDLQYIDVRGDMERAVNEITEAADSDVNHWDLPLNGTATSAKNITQTYSSAQASPYRWTDLQREQGSYEDSQS